MENNEIMRKLESLERKFDEFVSKAHLTLPMISSVDTKMNVLLESHMRILDSDARLHEEVSTLTSNVNKLALSVDKLTNNVNALVEALSRRSQ